MALFKVAALPEEALAASSAFHAEVLPKVLALLAPPRSGEDFLTLVFPPADHRHRGWRLAAVQALARRFAPVRVNAIASDDELAIAAARDYLEAAEGVTGQYLPLDSAGAGDVISLQP